MGKVIPKRLPPETPSKMPTRAAHQAYPAVDASHGLRAAMTLADHQSALEAKKLRPKGYPGMDDPDGPDDEATEA